MTQSFKARALNMAGQDAKRSCARCGKQGLRYGNKTGLCRQCFLRVPLIIKSLGAPVIREVFELVKAGKAAIAASRVGIPEKRLRALLDPKRPRARWSGREQK